MEYRKIYHRPLELFHVNSPRRSNLNVNKSVTFVLKHLRKTSNHSNFSFWMNNRCLGYRIRVNDTGVAIDNSSRYMLWNSLCEWKN